MSDPLPPDTATILTSEEVNGFEDHALADKSLSWGLHHNIRRIADSHELLRSRLQQVEQEFELYQRQAQAAHSAFKEGAEMDAAALASAQRRVEELEAQLSAVNKLMQKRHDHSDG